jgi:Holliday junction resolvase RusA-like endonuclease
MIRARDAMPRGWVSLERAIVSCRFYFKDRRRRDADNLLASLKAVFDGLKDAGVIDDDAGFIHLPIEMDHDPKSPRVVIEIRPL